MKILVTGAKGFVGRNLCAQLKNIRDVKARNYAVAVEDIYEYDIDSTPEELETACAQADFVFNLAGVNRPQNASEFMEGNFGFASTLLDTLKKYGNACPVMLSSSQQASLAGRFGNSEYGRSKKAGEDLFLEYGAATGAKVLVYRFPNLFGKWCRPNYNSAVATFCNAIANDLPFTVNDPSVEMELLYIDDLVDEMIACLRGEEHHCEFEGLERNTCKPHLAIPHAKCIVERNGQPHAVAPMVRKQPRKHRERHLNEIHVKCEVVCQRYDGCDFVLLYPFRKPGLCFLERQPISRVELVDGNGLRVDTFGMFRANPAREFGNSVCDGEVRIERNNCDFEDVVPGGNKTRRFEINGSKDVHDVTCYCFVWL